jgi:diguanylate cyclase (GGDEF)-like protein
MLNRAWGLNRVLETAFQAARQIVEFQTAAVTLYNRRRKRHKVAATWGEALDGTRDLEYADNSSLTAMAVKNKHYLPVGGRHRRNQLVFNRKVSLKQMRSVLVFPLIVGDNAIGTFVMASQTPDLFTEDQREMLGVICNQMAVSIQNGMMVRKLEELATTDGLTGLSNHRTFQERLTEMMARAERSGRLVSLVLCDIDHFKSVNDTHGHPVGDTVLKRVAQVLASSVRAIDVVARYGGEEFAVVLEETDMNGALLLAERIREEVSRQQFNSDRGPFNCTMSFGIATYPEHGAHKQLLIEHADQALYRAKQSGSNCTVCFTG